MITLHEQAQILPKTPGVYTFKDKQGKVLYVGKSISVRDRVVSHLAAKDGKSRAISENSTSVTSIPVTNELEALLLEAELIKKYLPPYNARAKDDKHALYIEITKEEFPRILTSRKEDNPISVFFGPFPASSTVKQVLRQIRKIFPYCSQNPGAKKACFYSHLGLCDPCPASIRREADSGKRKQLKAEYAGNIRRIRLLLDGKKDTLQKKLEAEMKKQATFENFEKASFIRDQLRKLSYITQPYNKISLYLENPNLLQDIREKEMSLLYKYLRPYFANLTLPRRIECFDVAHTGGEAATCSLVTFVEGEAEKNLYRRFRVRGLKTRDDFAMLSETVTRRLNHLKDWGTPDLILVDGGRGQVSVVRQVLDKNKVSIPVVGLAKRFEQVIIPLPFPQGFKVLRLSRDNPALMLLQRLRDEAHRFARVYHFKLRLRELLRT
ncbi:MAG: GIY-YIG nuclease family protein [Candidatus Blackburnbacteria bacterium]|nr:GIY-YIG nuclease family protein [Candidatus Blackburnbacteria bacterium]